MEATKSPVGARRLNVLGNIVAKVTVTAVMQGRSPPWIPRALVVCVENLQIAKDIARAVAVCRMLNVVSLLGSIPANLSANDTRPNP